MTSPMPIFPYLFVSMIILAFMNDALFAQQSETMVEHSFLKASQLLVDGKPTDFDTKPSLKNITIEPSHPRLMFKRTDIDGIRTKLNGPEYRADLAYLGSRKAHANYGGASIQAFRWQVFGDKKARDWAKAKLLSGDILRWGNPLHDSQWLFAWATTYDWLSDSLTQQERQAAWDKVKSKMGANINGFENDKFDKPFVINLNDSWGKRTPIYEAAVAIAIYGDGVDDQLAKDILEKVASGHESFISPYRMIDWLNLMALDSGGSQASHDTDNVSGYAGMYTYSCLLYHGYWETATSEPMWRQSNYFRLFPLWNTYDNDSPLQLNGRAAMEIVAGRYRELDPSMAALASWYLSQYGYGEPHNNLLLPRLIWGDRRIQPKSPEELELPLAKHLRGADCFVSRSSWDKNATVVNMATRTLDHLRYEPMPGVLSIYTAGKPILVDTRKGKWRRIPTTNSGIQLGSGIGATYYRRPHQWDKKIKRAQSVTQVATHPAYFPNCVIDQRVNELYRSVTVRYDHLQREANSNMATRTVIHLPHDPEFVVVWDQWEASKPTEYTINWRLVSEPIVQESGFVWDGAAATVVGPDDAMPLKWIGGIGHEIARLDGSWAGDNKSGFKPGYGNSPQLVNQMGLGNVYLTGTGSGRCVTVIAIGAEKAPQVRVTDDGVIFDQYQIAFQKKANFEVSKIGEESKE